MPVLIHIALLAHVLKFNKVRIVIATSVGMSNEFSPATTERHLLFRCQCLAREGQHMMLQEQAVDFFPLIVAQSGDINIQNCCTQGC